MPPGEYLVKVFHERATPAVLERAGRRVTINGSTATLAPIAISESGYLPIPHKNKFGRDYPPVTDETSVYPAVKK